MAEERVTTNGKPETPDASPSAATGMPPAPAAPPGSDGVSSVAPPAMDGGSSAAPTLADDLARLESMNWFQASLVRIRRGKHPDPQIEALLERRLGLPRSRFQAPYVVGLLSTLAWVLTFCSLAWVGLWALGSLAGFTGFVWLVSGLMTTLLAALLGLAVSQPIVFVDEKALEEEGLSQIARLKAMTEMSRDRPPASEAAVGPAESAPRPSEGTAGEPAGPVPSRSRE